jgi:hypothetical protein
MGVKEIEEKRRESEGGRNREKEHLYKIEAQVVRKEWEGENGGNWVRKIDWNRERERERESWRQMDRKKKGKGWTNKEERLKREVEWKKVWETDTQTER